LRRRPRRVAHRSVEADAKFDLAWVGVGLVGLGILGAAGLAVWYFGFGLATIATPGAGRFPFTLVLTLSLACLLIVAVGMVVGNFGTSRTGILSTSLGSLGLVGILLLIGLGFLAAMYVVIAAVCSQGCGPPRPRYTPKMVAPNTIPEPTRRRERVVVPQPQKAVPTPMPTSPH
jgi:hypothetical protein